MQLITKETLREEMKKNGAVDRAVVYKTPIMSDAGINAAGNETLMDTEVVYKSDSYKSPYEIKLNGRDSVADRIARGSFSLHVPADLYDFIDATRLDVTRRKMAEPILAGFMYNMLSNPNFSRTMTVQELSPIGIVFDELEGSGDGVRLGTFPTGDTATLTQTVKGCGYSWDLVFELYNDLFNMQRLNEAVAVAYAAKVNDDHISPILGGTYAGAKATAASTVGTAWREKLYNTISNGIRDLGKRTDPTTGKPIDVTNCILLCSKSVALDVEWVIRGQLNKFADKENLGSIPGIAAVIGYDGESITVGNETVSYSGVGSTYVYLVSPNNRAFISAWKRPLTALVQAQGDILRLERERRAWMFVNGVYNTFGIANNVQKITLPTIGG